MRQGRRGVVGKVLGRSLLILFVMLSAALDGLTAQVVSLDTPGDDTLAVQATVVRRLIEVIRADHPLGPLKTVCLFLLEDGRWLGDGEVGRSQPGLEQFLADARGLRPRPRAKCVKGGDSYTLPERLYRDADNGEAAVLLRIFEPTFGSRTEATLAVGYHFGPLWGQGFECHLKRTASGWQIVEWTPTWIS